MEERVGLDAAWRLRTAESPLRNPREFFTLLLVDMRRAFYLGYVLFVRDFSAKYRQTLFGYLWAVLPVAFTTLLFIALSAAKVLQTTQADIPYPLFVLTGTVLWQTFFDSLMGPISGVQRSKTMLLKLNFPKEAVVVSALLEAAFNLVLRLLIVGVVLLCYSSLHPTGFLWFSLSTLSLVFLGTVLGVLFVPLSLLFHDVQYALATFAGLWFFATPVVYPIPAGGTARSLLLLNPVSPLLTSSRAVLFNPEQQFPAAYFVILILALVTAALTWVFYRVAMPHVIERLGE
ncbi:MAG TPA: ABC transporter permease [Oligoflexia bacterium]|nr:ABC transporter permease [Oligoflexia bacterium]